MEAIWKDAIYAGKALRRAPGFVGVAVLTLALGIGANTAIFSVVRAVLLRPLPYEDPDCLVLVWGEMPNRGVENFPASRPELRDYRETTTVFEDLAGFFTFPQPLTGDFEPRQVMTAGVSTSFFSVLGVEPMIGRDFVPSEGGPVEPGLQPGDPGFGNLATILSHGLWQQRFAGDPGVLGRIVELGGIPAEIVGVMPPGFRLLTPEASSVAEDVDAWFAMRVDAESAPRGNVFLDVVGRLRTGVTVAQAQAEMDGIAAEFRRLYELSESTGFRIEVVSLHEDVTEHVRPVSWALLGAVAFVLLIACANVSNLLLVRASTRERELAVRAALGGSRGRLVRQLLGESLLLAGAGAVLGVALAWLGIRLLVVLRPEDLPRIESVALDGTVLGFTASATLLAVLLFGVLPSLRASRPDLTASLEDGGRAGRASSGRGRPHLRRFAALRPVSGDRRPHAVLRGPPGAAGRPAGGGVGVGGVPPSPWTIGSSTDGGASRRRSRTPGRSGRPTTAPSCPASSRPWAPGSWPVGISRAPTTWTARPWRWWIGPWPGRLFPAVPPWGSGSWCASRAPSPSGSRSSGSWRTSATRRWRSRAGAPSTSPTASSGASEP